MDTIHNENVPQSSESLPSTQEALSPILSTGSGGTHLLSRCLGGEDKGIKSSRATLDSIASLKTAWMIQDLLQSN